MDDFVAVKADGNDSEGVKQMQDKFEPLITTYHDAIRWAKKIKMFGGVRSRAGRSGVVRATSICGRWTLSLRIVYT